MTDQALPKFVSDLTPGSSTSDPAAIEEALRSQQVAGDALLGTQQQPMRFTDTPSADEQVTTATAAELKPVDKELPKFEVRRGLIPDAKLSSEGAPAWAKIPSDFTFPRGRQTYFLRFPGTWTYTPWKGERQVILWQMSVGDKRIALQRSMGDQNRATDELVKSTIRAIDGRKVDGATADLDIWWDEIGEACRGLLIRIHAQAHFLNPQELDLFLKDCIEVRSPG